MIRLCVPFVVRRAMFRLCPTSFASKVGTSSDQDGAEIVEESLEADRLEEIDNGVHNALSNIVSDVCAAEKVVDVGQFQNLPSAADNDKVVALSPVLFLIHVLSVLSKSSFISLSWLLGLGLIC